MSNTIAGFCDPKFAQLKTKFDRNFAELGELGASVCLSVHGETLVDMWGGVIDAETRRPWQQDTVSLVFSCTKAATALCAHVLIYRGELDLDALVTDYWPECGLAFSYTMTQMGDGLFLNERGQCLVDAAYRAMGYRSNAPGAWVR